MFINRIILVFTFCIFFSCNRKEPAEKIDYQDLELNNKINDSLVYSFINNTLLKEKKCDYLFNKTPDIFLEDYTVLKSKIDSIFSEEDLKFLETQYRLGKKFVYEKQKIRDINLIEVDSILINRLESDLYREAMDILYQQYGCFYLIGIPLFNREKNIIVVNTFYYCGLECGEKSIYIYKKNVNGEWVLYKTVEKIFS